MRAKREREGRGSLCEFREARERAFPGKKVKACGARARFDLSGVRGGESERVEDGLLDYLLGNTNDEYLGDCRDVMLGYYATSMYRK